MVFTMRNRSESLESLDPSISISGLNADLDVNDISDVENLCRLCMCSPENYPKLVMIEIMEETSHSNVPVVDLFRDGLNINIKDSLSGMPTQVCLSCLLQLQSFTSFKKKSHNVDAKLQYLVSKKMKLAEARELYGPALFDGERLLVPSTSLHLDVSDNVAPDVSVQTLNTGKDDLQNIEHSTLGVCLQGEELKTLISSDLQDECRKTDCQIRTFNKHELPTNVNMATPGLKVIEEPPQDKNHIQCISNTQENPNGVIKNALSSCTDDRNSTGPNRAIRRVANNGKKIKSLSQSLSQFALKSWEVPQVARTIAHTSKSTAPHEGSAQQHPLQCTVCDSDKAFSNVSQLEIHERTHSKSKGDVCSVCDKSFRGKNALMRHERIHSGEKPFKCILCDRDFTQKEILQRHILTHTDEKPFACTHCNKSYTQKEGLANHVKQHHQTMYEIRQYPCLQCDKAFCHPSGLSRHMMIHSGKQFVCDICSRTFTDVSSFRRHQKTQHVTNKK